MLSYTQRYTFGAILIALITLPALAFDSGSDGSDGALELTTPGTYDFFQLPLDHSDGIYHFTTVYLGVDVILEMRSSIKGPVTWLASGAVSLDGHIDLDGRDGHGTSSQFRAVPGAGGFAGGTGGNDLLDPTAGSGPGGGFPGFAGSSTQSGGGAGHAIAGEAADNNGGAAYGNEFLLPLIGGSGGGGGFQSGSITSGYGGGAGGGAMLIASSLLVELTGRVSALGGASVAAIVSTAGGGGSGGSLRFVAPLVSGTGSIQAFGSGGPNTGSAGRIRIEAYDNQFAGTVAPPASTGLPGVVSIPPSQMPLRIVSVGGVAVPASPTGVYSPPDVVLNTASPVTVEVEASGVPLSTTVVITLFTDSGLLENVETPGLTGSLEQSSAAVQILVPNGFAGLYATANWTP